jgi:multiple sugar transport system permease protein
MKMTSQTAVTATARPRRAPAPAVRRARHRTAWRATGFLAPFAALFLTMMVAPIGYAIYQSFFKVHRAGLLGDQQTTRFAGFENFVNALRDTAFTSAILRVVLIGVVQVPVMLGIALGLALLLDSRSARFKKTFRLVFFLPYALPGAIATIMWSYLLVKDLSPFTAPLASLGFHGDLVGPTWFPLSIGNMITWGWTGYNMLIIYSALQAIPPSLAEAATIDGCSAGRMVWHVKIPLVRPALLLTTVFSIIGTAQLYTEPAVLYAAHDAHGATSTFTPIMNITAIASQGDQNLASAEAVVLALVTLVMSFGFLKVAQRKAAAS